MRKLSILLVLIIVTLAGCGGGGGGSSTSSVVDDPGTGGTGTDGNNGASRTTVLKISTDGTAEKKIASLSITIALPAGATVKTEGGAVAVDVVQPSGVTAGIADVSMREYTAAAAGNPAKINFMLIGNNKQNPLFGTGESATVTIMTADTLASGTETQVLEVSARDTLGNSIGGITAKAIVQ